MITASAILISMVTAVGLVFTDAATVQRLRATQRFTTESPPSGSLSGRNASDGSEWAPRESGEQAVVLFVVGAAGRNGDVEFWRDVAARGIADAPGSQFVGLCAAGKSCSLPAGAESVLTLLTAMDPVQVHALSMAAIQGLALVYRGAELKRVHIQGDRQALAAELVGIDRADERGGA